MIKIEVIKDNAITSVNLRMRYRVIYNFLLLECMENNTTLIFIKESLLKRSFLNRFISVLYKLQFYKLIIISGDSFLTEHKHISNYTYKLINMFYKNLTDYVNNDVNYNFVNYVNSVIINEENTLLKTKNKLLDINTTFSDKEDLRNKLISNTTPIGVLGEKPLVSQDNCQHNYFPDFSSQEKTQFLEKIYQLDDNKKLEENEKLILVSYIYSEYPKKVGKKSGINKLCRMLKKCKDFKLVLKALENYKNVIIKEKRSPKYVMQFSTFANKWEDFLETTYLVETDI